MAENKETIVLEINATDALSQIAEMQKEMNALREAQKGFTTDSAEYQALAGRIRIVTKDQGDLKRALDASVKARRQEIDTTTFSNNSIAQNRELLKQLTAQYIQMRQPNEALTAQIKKLSDNLKVQEAAIGDTRRNVGNYTESMSMALGAVSKLPGAAGQAASGVQAMSAAFAAGTGPIGLILTAISALIPILQNNAEFADEMTFAMDGLTKAFEVLINFAIDGVKQLGFLKNAFSDPIGTIKQLGEMIANNLINRFKALGGFIEAISLAFQGKWSEASRAALNATTQLATGIENLGGKVVDAYKSGDKASRQFDALTEAMGRAENAAKEYDKQAIILERSLKNTTLSEQERIKIANQAADNYIKAAKTRQQAAILELRAQEELLKGDQASDEERKKLNDLRHAVKMAAMDADEAIAQRQTRIDKLLAKEAKESSKEVVKSEQDKTKALEEEQKKREALIQKGIEDERTLRVFRIEQEEDSLSKRLALFDAQSEAEEEKLRAMGATEIELAEARNQQIGEITDKFNKEQQDKKDKADAEALAKAKQQAEEEATIQQAKFEAASSVANALTAIGQAVLGNSAAGLAFQKAMALVDIGISTATSIAAVVAAATKDAISKPGGVFTLIATVATGIATVTANIMKATQLLSQSQAPSPPELQTFAEGGEVFTLGGKRHRDGGTKFVGSDGTRFEAEQGEKIFVMKRTASAAIDRLGSFNQLFGGNAWGNSLNRYAEDGGLVFDGGMTTRSLGGNDLAAQLQQAVANMPAPVVSVKEINTVNTRRAIAQEQAGL